MRGAVAPEAPTHAALAASRSRAAAVLQWQTSPIPSADARCSSTPSRSSPARSCCSSSSRSSRSRSCRGSAARRRSGPRASCSSRRRCSRATRTRTSSCAASRRARRSCCTSRCSSRASSLLPIVPGAFWKPAGDENPSWLILGLLDGDDRPALLPAVDDQPAGAGVVRAALPRPQSVPAVRAVEPRVDAGAGRLPVPARAVGRRRARRRWAGRSGYALFVVLCAAAGCASLQRTAARHASVGARQPARRPPCRRRRPPSAPPTLAPPAPVVRARRDRVAAAARGVEPHHAEHRGGAAAVDRAAHALPADVHPLLRRHAAGTGATSSCRCSPRRSA